MKASLPPTLLVPVQVWDLPVRLFHWLLVPLVAAAVASGIAGGQWIEWHGRAGMACLGLVSFRLAWGVVGSAPARFANFLPTTGRLAAWRAGRWNGVGHNPVGALSVVALLALVAGQAATGLFASDDIAFEGPLRVLAAPAVAAVLDALHRKIFVVLLAMIALHVAAIGWYRHRGEDLVRPMITGVKQLPAPARPAAGARASLAAFVVAAGFAAGVCWSIGSGALAGWIAPAPPPPPAGATPSW